MKKILAGIISQLEKPGYAQTEFLQQEKQTVRTGWYRRNTVWIT